MAKKNSEFPMADAKKLYSTIEQLAWELDDLAAHPDGWNVEEMRIRHAQNARAFATDVLLEYNDSLRGGALDLPWSRMA